MDPKKEQTEGQALERCSSGRDWLAAWSGQSWRLLASNQPKRGDKEGDNGSCPTICTSFTESDGFVEKKVWLPHAKTWVKKLFVMTSKPSLFGC